MPLCAPLKPWSPATDILVVFRLGFSFLFAFVMDMGVAGFMLGDAMARLGPITVSGTYYLSGAWRNRKRLVEDPG